MSDSFLLKTVNLLFLKRPVLYTTCYKLKYGLLKRIYEYKSLPVQCFITANKDLVFNEKTRKCSRNICLKNAVSEPIFPCNYNCFEDFINEICSEWFNCYELTHKN